MEIVLQTNSRLKINTICALRRF